MSENDVPIPGSSLIFFFLITVGFTVISLISIQNAKSIEAIENAKDSSLLNIIYICVIIIGSYFINTTVSKALCQSNSIQWSSILIATLLPWTIIFLSLYIILQIFPGWITPFSNTIGYLVITILGVEKTLTEILNTNADTDDLIKAIANIRHNKSNFINQIDINQTNFIDFIKQLVDTRIIDKNKLDALANAPIPETTASPSPGETASPSPGETATATPTATPPPAPVRVGGSKSKAIKKYNIMYGGDTDDSYKANFHIQNLYKLLVIKNMIGKITWYTLAGVLVSSISYNYITNMSCEKSLEEIQRDINNANANSLEYDLENS